MEVFNFLNQPTPTDRPVARHIAPLATDEVFITYRHAIRCVIEYSKINSMDEIRYSPEECFMLAVALCRRLIAKYNITRKLDRELEDIVEEYGTNSELLPLTLMICRELVGAVADSDLYENIKTFDSTWISLNKNLYDIAARNDKMGIADIWHKAAMKAQSDFINQRFSYYLLPQLPAESTADTQGEIASLVETTLRGGNITDCENLKNLLLNFDHTHDNRYKAEVDTLIDGINRLRQGSYAPHIENNHIYESGSTHNDHSKHLTMGNMHP